jgi:hypothetical protein
MKLRNIPVKEKAVQVMISMRQSVASDFDRYVKYVTAQTGQRLSRGEVATLVIEQFMADDRDFKRFVRDKKSANNPSSDEPGSS